MMFTMSATSMLIIMVVGCVGMNTIVKEAKKTAIHVKNIVKTELDGLKKKKTD